MPYANLLTPPKDIIYLYDGSLAGFFCCVYESVYEKELPFAILPQGEAQLAMFFKKRIETDWLKAQKVRKGIAEKLTLRTLKLAENVFLSCLADKERAILRFLLLAFQEGHHVLEMLSHPDVAPLLEAERHMMSECHLLTGFVRFSDCDGKLVAAISPKNFVLPYLTDHFVGRFSNEEFMIYDKTHKAALIYQNRQSQIVPLEAEELPQASEKEENYRALWRKFYKTIAIQDRYNPKCRMTHMPKRYWENMTEMQELL